MEDWDTPDDVGTGENVLKFPKSTKVNLDTARAFNQLETA